MALYALQHGYKRAAFMMSSITTAQDFIPYIEGAYKAGGGTIVANETLRPGLTSYRTEALKVAQSQPQVIFSQIEPPTAAVLTQDFKEINNLAIPIIASDTSAAAEWIKAVTPAVANKAVVSCEGATATSPATPVFMKYFNQDFKGQQPLASATYSYDATMALALAIDKAGTTTGPAYAKDIPLVTSPRPARWSTTTRRPSRTSRPARRSTTTARAATWTTTATTTSSALISWSGRTCPAFEQVVGTVSAAQLEEGTPKGACTPPGDGSPPDAARRTARVIVTTQP